MARNSHGDVISKGTVVVDGGRKVIGNGRLTVYEETEVMGTRQE